MAAAHPSHGSHHLDKTTNPIFPPMSQSTINSIPRPIFPPNVLTPLSPLSQPANPLILPPTQPFHPNLTSPLLPSTSSNTNTGFTPPTTNIYNPFSTNQPPLATTTQNAAVKPTIRPMYPSPATAYRPQTQSIPSMLTANSYPSISNSNIHSTQPSSSVYPFSQFNNTNTSFTSNVPSTYPEQTLPTVPFPSTNNITPSSVNQQLHGSISTNNNFVDLLKVKSVVSSFIEDPPLSPLVNEKTEKMCCNPEVMRCSLNVIPQTKDLLNKSRLPFGVLIHPFKDLESLSVIQGTKIVRCDACKSYINPFVTILETTQWRCSICFRVNDLPQEFLYDPITKTYGDPCRRPEVRFGTVEYIATPDYATRPPPPAMYLFLLDVSHNAIQTGYLQSFCDILFENLSNLPGDARTQIGFLSYDSRIHFYDLSDRQNGTFRIIIMPDLENIESKTDEFFPLPDGLMVTLSECRTNIEALLNELPKVYSENSQTDSALGAALLIAGRLLHETGGRVTVIQTRLPNINPGALNEQIVKELKSIGPTSDFYKKLALEYASQQTACDLFLLNSHYIDLATLTCISKYSAGEVKYYPHYHSIQTPYEVERFENDLRRYLQRKIGFEAVMRLRTSPAISIHTFHGNGFVRTVDLLVLPNINPDAAYGMQMAIDDSLAHYKSVAFQIALLYTTSKGERRIRVHTLSLPVSTNLSDIYAHADQEAIVSLITKMAADRSITSLHEAREALTNVACDIVKAAMLANGSNREYSLVMPNALRLLPLYMLSTIKSTAFRTGSSTRLDDHACYIDLCKTLPTQFLMQIIYPDLYPIHTIEEKSHTIQDGDEELQIPERIQLSFQYIDSHGAYVLDTGEYIYIYIGKTISNHFLENVFNVSTFSALPFDSYSLPSLDNSLSTKIHNFLTYLVQDRTNGVGIHIMREDSSKRHFFTSHFVDDRSESTMSYQEFLRHIQNQITK